MDKENNLRFSELVEQELGIASASKGYAYLKEAVSIAMQSEKLQINDSYNQSK